MKRRYVDVPFGQVHVAEEGEGRPVVLLHQTPRSSDEFAEVLPELGRRWWAIAVDLPGMGASSPHPEGASIEGYADGVLAAADGLGLDAFDLVGHHTGGVVAVEVAARVPGRVRRLVLSSTPLIDAAGRAARRERPPIDAMDVRDDGSHLTDLWHGRQRFYPSGRPDILTRFVIDALRAADPEDGHRAVARYRMEDRLPLVRAETLVVGHAADPHAYPALGPLAGALGGAETAVIEDGMVPLELTAPAFAAIVEEFLGR